jgi:hypothetical protein
MWLRNKLAAMSAVLPHPPSETTHVACEYALAARLLLEEQTLDQNRSTGKQGKYAIKFHPRKDIAGVTSSTGTRPLTVGELSTNWRDGLRETLLIKYQSPLPVLEETVRNILCQSSTTLSLYTQTKFALQNTCQPMLVKIRHPSDANMVLQSLKSVGMTVNSKPTLTFCSPDMASRDFLLQLLHQAKNDKALHRVVYVDSSYYRLESLTELFGDFIPRHGTNTAKTVVAGTTLSLYLAEWAVVNSNFATNRNAQLEQAMVYPWTDVLSWDQAEALLLSTESNTAFQ